MSKSVPMSRETHGKTVHHEVAASQLRSATWVALADHARSGSDEVLLASWIALHRQLSQLGTRRAAHDRRTLAIAMDAIENEMKIRGMTTAEFDALDEAATMAAQA